MVLAVRVGFEPTDPLRGQRISSALLSATQPPHRTGVKYTEACQTKKEPGRSRAQYLVLLYLRGFRLIDVTDAHI